MLHSTFYKTSMIEASKKSLEGLLELHQEMVEALATLQIIFEGHDTPLNPQTLEELKQLYTTAHRMLSTESAQVSHIEMMQEAHKNAETVFGDLMAGRLGKSNQTPGVTA